MTSTSQLWQRKAVRDLNGSAEHSGLVRSIGLAQLSLLGIGATVGTGIFFVLSVAVPLAGPAAVVSFVVAGVVAGLTALCYAELAGAVPVSGSSYSYAYATLGELAAVLVGACLLLEYGVSAAAVAVGWSQYVNELLENVAGLSLPAAVSNAPEQGGVVNLPAVLLVVICALLLCRGTSESAKINAVMVVTKLAVLVFFVAVAVSGWQSDHFSSFAPHGLHGITTAAGVIFFSFIGLDAVSTAGDEVKDPQRTMPRAIVIALVTVTAVYVAVALAAVGAQAPGDFADQEAGLAAILERVTGATWPSTLLAVGAVVSIFSITLVVIYGQTRILFCMSRDGLVPGVFSQVDAKRRVPVRNTIIVSVVVALLAGLVPINFLAEMTSVGTLVAFMVVSLGVIVLRRREPGLPRSFKVPGYPVTPVLAIAGCLWIVQDLRPVTLWVFLVWLGAAVAWYAAYGYRHSTLRTSDSVVDELV